MSGINLGHPMSEQCAHNSLPWTEARKCAAIYYYITYANQYFPVAYTLVWEMQTQWVMHTEKANEIFFQIWRPQYD